MGRTWVALCDEQEYDGRWERVQSGVGRNEDEMGKQASNFDDTVES